MLAWTRNRESQKFTNIASNRIATSLCLLKSIVVVFLRGSWIDNREVPIGSRDVAPKTTKQHTIRRSRAPGASGWEEEVKTRNTRRGGRRRREGNKAKRLRMRIQVL